MGWKSTIDLTREEAEAMLEGATEGASDEDLAEAVEAIMGGESHGANYRIVTKEFKYGRRDAETT